ncbi:ABC transporter ATP-binding protein [Chondromyces apiculatus]|uniref:ABC transporter n=1 Tax=Chondromyces apiculatus DSM 436 TaxID=1192034 RepID=A0A017T505_9BACT|nr:ABC transporter ATP-binding protein [Chondromyces apiculatus]EYF04052.1 ABC transporter [Chondromyces apiculatus DSM 436]
MSVIEEAIEEREALPPLFEAHEVRIAVDDVVAIEGLTCATHGDRLLCTGETQALLGVLLGVPLAARGRRGAGEPEGEARVVAGTLRLAGREVGRAAHRSIAGGAMLDPPLPVAWTAEAYVSWSAKLGGGPARAGRDLARAALTKVGLGHAALRQIGGLSLHERRALGLAAAVALSPAVVVLEDPLSGLDGSAAAFVMAAVAAVTEGRQALISVGHLRMSGATGALLQGATDLLVLAEGALVFAGAPAEVSEGRRVYALVTRGQVERLREALEGRGLGVRGGTTRLLVTLREGMTTRDIVAAAAEARAPLLEMVPVIQGGS